MAREEMLHTLCHMFRRFLSLLLWWRSLLALSVSHSSLRPIISLIILDFECLQYLFRLFVVANLLNVVGPSENPDLALSSKSYGNHASFQGNWPRPRM